VTTYKELNRWSEAFVKGAFPLFFLIGNPGHAKSWNIKRLVAEERERAKKQKKAKRKKKNVVIDKLPDNHIPEPLYIKGGAVSSFMLYKQLYLHLHETIVLDDVDSIYSDRNLVRLLKALCESEKEKVLGWWTANRQLEAEEIPSEFKTRSRVCIIANRWKELSDHVSSLMSRGVMIRFDPSVGEVFMYIKKQKIITDREILGFVATNLWMIDKVDIRDFINAVDAKKARLDWRDALAQSLGIRDMLIVETLSQNKSFQSNEQRAAEFMRMTGQSRPMYFKASSKLADVKSQKKEKARQHP
jgi:hypothetical protein